MKWSKRQKMKLRIAARQGGKMMRDGNKRPAFLTPCHYCSNRFRMQHLTFDHVIRKRDGGKFTFSNLVLACQLCNQAREDSIVGGAMYRHTLTRHRQILQAL